MSVPALRRGAGERFDRRSDKAARRAFSVTFSITQRDATYRHSPVLAVDSVRRDWSGAPSERGARRCCERTARLWLARSRL